MRPGYTVNKYLKYLYIDDNETRVYHQMQQRRYGLFEHLFLTQGQQHHIPPTLVFVIGEVFVTTQQYVASHFLYLFGEEINRSHRANDK
jgi:hypothetical protein